MTKHTPLGKLAENASGDTSASGNLHATPPSSTTSSTTISSRKLTPDSFDSDLGKMSDANSAYSALSKGSLRAITQSQLDPELSPVLQCLQMANCTHIDSIQEVTPQTQGCEECLKAGGKWVHLRLCLTCGHVGCCDSSRHKHATQHFHTAGHPVVKSLEPGEKWGWCYIDRVELDVP